MLVINSKAGGLNMIASTAYMLEKKEGIHSKTNLGDIIMEPTLCREIVVETRCVGTTDIMDYADEHPNEYFGFTEVRSKHTDYGRLMVSEYNPQFKNEEGWHDLYNGWQRKSACDGVWVCRKNGRYIIITN